MAFFIDIYSGEIYFIKVKIKLKNDEKIEI